VTGGLEATLSRDASSPMRIGLRGEPGVWVELSLEGAEPIGGEVKGSAVVFPRAFVDADTVQIAEPSRVEEIRIARTQKALEPARYRVRHGANVSHLRVTSDARIEVVEIDGRVRLSTLPMVAFDARGTRRTVDAKIDDGSLVTWIDAQDLSLPIVIDPVWTAPGSMTSPRRTHMAVLLPSGKVLVAGGHNTPDYPDVSSAETFDPAGSGTFSAVAAMKQSVTDTTAVLTAAGKVFIAGGNCNAGIGVLDSAELYDPASNTWSFVASMTRKRFIPTVTLLSSGKILVTGGSGYGGDSNSEVYDPTSNTWSAPVAMIGLHASHTATRLASGKVVVIGSEGFGTGAESYDPTTDTWTALASGPSLNSGHTATLLSDGRILVVGGTPGGVGDPYSVSSANLYDPTANTWTAVPSMVEPRTQHTATLLSSGRVLVTGGMHFGSYPKLTEVYDPATNKWYAAGSLAIARSEHTATRLADGRVVVVGGLTDIGVVSSAEIYAPLPSASACTTTGECASGYCADGVCCDKVCNGACETCKATGSVGTCSALTGAPLAGHATCGAYAACIAGACKSTCTTIADCTSGNYCDSTGTCVPQKDAGTLCTASSECKSGSCADGFCCDRACTAQCEACDLAGKSGTCSPVFGAPHGGRSACTGTGVGTECGSACNGVDATKCNYPSTTTACGGKTCKSGIETHDALCDGAGKCGDVPKACGSYACGPTACATTCSTKDDCAAGFYCKSSACVPVETLGKACTDPSGCASSLFCTEGFCCGVGSCSSGSSCAVVGKEGVCTKLPGSGCATGAECGSEFCVDSVCCESACTGQCQSCHVPGKAGKCVAVAGAPVGGRPECTKDTTNVCATTSCDGSDGTKCLAFVGSETTCRAPECKDGVATLVAKCTGSGKCPDLVKAPCGGFGCDDTTKACRTSCTKAEDCVAGYGCEGGKCKRKAGTCSADGKALVAADGTIAPCAPFVCKADKCLSACETSEDCASGLICDTASKTCETPSAAAETTDSGGGCNTGRGTSSAPFAGFFALASVIAVARRRLRRSYGSMTIASIGVVLALACSSSRTLDMPPQPTARASTIETIRAAMPSLVIGHMERTSRGFHALPTAVATGAFAWKRLDQDALDATFPTHAGDPMHLAIRGESGFFLDVSADDALPVAAEMHDSMLVMKSFADDADLVHVAAPGRAEELRVLHGDRAPSTTRHRIHSGPAVASVRLRDGRVEALDADGRVRIASERLFAIDARGERRDLASSLEERDGDRYLVSRLETSGLAYPIVIDPAWTATGGLVRHHLSGGIGRLPSGAVIAAGGGGDGALSMTSAEIFDPATSTWMATGNMASGRDRPASAVLASGKFLMAGGVDYSTPCHSSAELFNPSTGTWSATGSMPEIHAWGIATVLSTGKVLVTGGQACASAVVYDAALYDPGLGTWTTSGSTATPHLYHTASLLSGDRVLVTGGYDELSLAYYSTAERWSAGTFSTRPSMSVPRSRHVATTLKDGRILVTGGYNGVLLSSAEIYDPTLDKWTSVAPMNVKRIKHTAALLPSGRVLVMMGEVVITGYATSSTEVYDPSTDKWLDAGNVSGPVGNAMSTSLADGRVLLVASFPYTFTELASGDPCDAPGQCVTGYCTDGVCCNVATCGAGSTCATAEKPGVCAKVNGTKCSADGECGTNHCVDSVCCNAACVGQCEACDVTGSVGTCTAATGQSHGTRLPCDDGGSDPCHKRRCDGTIVTSCQLLPAGTVACGASTCSTGIETHASTCNGAGKCSDVPKLCGAYSCGSTACNTTCATKSDCAPGYYCKASTCVALEGLGTSCTDSSTCASGLTCVDSVCCGSPSCGTGSSCALAGRKGSCTKTPGTTCSVDVECGSGLCVDSVCCDRACDGQCEACDVAGSIGACAPVKGNPHGARKACEIFADDKICQTAVCDGKDATKCVGYVGGDVGCRVPSCKDGTFSAGAVCDGKGVCPPSETAACGGFACDIASATCKAFCAGPADCVKGFDCRGGVCKPTTDVCATSGSAVTHPDGTETSCAPFACKAGACLKECASTSDCAGGTVCDTASKQCVSPDAAAGSSGGCAMSDRSRSGDGAFDASLLVLAVLVLRRRTR